MTSFKKATLAGFCALAALYVGTAQATPLISLGLSQDASHNHITTVATSSTGQLTYAGAYGTFNSVTVLATGVPLVPQATFQTTSIDTKTTQAGQQDLYIWLTQQGLTQPMGITNFLSGFTANVFSGNVTSVVETTYISASNELFGGTQLATRTFTSAPGAASVVTASPNLTGTFSETVEYIIHLGGAGSVNDSINIQAVPEPTSLALLGAGMIGTGVMARRRRQPSMTATAA